MDPRDQLRQSPTLGYLAFYTRTSADTYFESVRSDPGRDRPEYPDHESAPASRRPRLQARRLIHRTAGPVQKALPNHDSPLHLSIGVRTGGSIEIWIQNDHLGTQGGKFSCSMRASCRRRRRRFEWALSWLRLKRSQVYCLGLTCAKDA